MKLKISTILKFLLIFFVLFILEYFRLLTNCNQDIFKIAFAILGVFLAFIVIIANKKNNLHNYDRYKFLVNFLKIYVPIILVSITYSAIIYSYSLFEIVIAVSNYLLIFYAFPLIYIFDKDDGVEKYLNVIYCLTIIMLLIKTYIWYMYNYNGNIIFENILFQHSDNWIRGDFLRVDAGFLFDLSFCYGLYNVFSKKKTLLNITILSFLFFYNIFINQWRTRLIIMIIVIILQFITSSKNNKTSAFKRAILIVIAVIIAISGGVDYIYNIFSVNGNEGGSTLARFETFNYYLNIIINNRSILGLGIMTRYNPAVYALTIKSAYKVYWLVDLGIISGLFQFGILFFPLYGTLLNKTRKLYKNIVSKKYINERILVTNLIVIMWLSCIVFNIFDNTSIYNFPFYMAIFSYFAYEANNK